MIEEAIQDLKRGKLTMPPDADPADFLISGGKVTVRPALAAKPSSEPERPPTLKSMFDTYEATLTPGSKEGNSLSTEAVHRKHFLCELGEDLALDSLGLDTIQGYVDARARDVGRETIRKELSTFRVIWGWAYKRRHVPAPLSWKMADLTFPKAREKPPFQACEQITRKIARGGLTEAQQAELWECLWLDLGRMGTR